MNFCYEKFCIFGVYLFLVYVYKLWVNSWSFGGFIFNGEGLKFVVFVVLFCVFGGF
jgi:hypothetical protein